MVVPPVAFQVGNLSEAAVLLLAGGTAAYAALTGVYAWRAFRVRLEDRWSAALATLVMGGLAALLWSDGARLLPAPYSVALLAVYVGAVLVTLTWTLGRYQDKVEVFKREFGRRLDAILHDVLPEERHAELRRLQERFQLDPEGRRKTPHLMMGVFLLFYTAVGYPVLRGISALTERSGAGGEMAENLRATVQAGWLASGHLFSLFALFLILFAILPTELLRLRYPELSYPFKAIILTRLRPREAGLFGAHYYIAATTPLAVLWLTRDAARWDVTVPAVLAVVAVSVFADAASALVGIRFGRAKWFHNPRKSYAGSAGGVAVAFLVALPFVGLPMAVASAVVFLVVDALAPVPVSVSDNILNPLALAACYTVGRGLLDPLIPYY